MKKPLDGRFKKIFDMKKKILHLLQRFIVGGKEEIVKNLMLAPSNKFIPYACALQVIGFMAEQVINAGLNVYFIDVSIKKTRIHNFKQHRW